jgi:hypothetical protein
MQQTNAISLGSEQQRRDTSAYRSHAKETCASPDVLTYPRRTVTEAVGEVL